MNSNVSTVDYNISRFFIQMRTNVNVTRVTYASESLSKMMAVCRRLPATEPLDTQQPGAARRGPAREHPGGPFGNERGRRRPRKSVPVLTNSGQVPKTHTNVLVNTQSNSIRHFPKNPPRLVGCPGPKRFALIFEQKRRPKTFKNVD